MVLKALLAVAIVVVTFTGCGDAGPSAASLRDSFAQQLSANKFVTDFQRSGDEMTFSGPTPEGGKAAWRVHIDSAVVEPTDKPAQPYKGTVKSSWVVNGQTITPAGSESNLPIELISNGLSQDCWALWDANPGRWGWE
jgi:hypothetical protein